MLGGVKDDIPNRALSVPLWRALVGEQQQPPSLGAGGECG